MSAATPALRLQGTPVVPGVALAPAVVACTRLSSGAVSAFEAEGFADEDAAMAAFDEAAADVAAGLGRRAEQVHGDAAELLTVTATLVRDPGLRAAVAEHLRPGRSLLAALHAAVEQFTSVFTGMGGLAADRVSDLEDIERRLVARLVGDPEPGVPVPAAPSVLLAEDLAPSDAAILDGDRVVALVTERGGPTSHTAIIARQLGIPCVVGVEGLATVRPGAQVLVDGTSGEVTVDPDPATAAARVATAETERAALRRWEGPGRTADGIRVALLANVADEPSARAAAAEPVDGVGLFRTELCFLDRAEEPTVAEQAALYTAVLSAFPPRHRVVVRTLDAGADKPLVFASGARSANPALGVRGLRLSFDNPGLLDRQLEAIATAAARSGADAWVMAPMVATPAEAEHFAQKARSHGLRPGVMVEIPSAALQASHLLEVVDFLSIGTNDLTQYTMAADRMAGDLAHLTDPWQPAVLSLVASTARAGSIAGKPVGVCGEAAADPLLAAALVGMGVTSLSMAAAAVRAVGARLAAVTTEACQEAAEAALGATDPMRARYAVRRVLNGQ